MTSGELQHVVIVIVIIISNIINIIVMMMIIIILLFCLQAPRELTLSVARSTSTVGVVAVDYTISYSPAPTSSSPNPTPLLVTSGVVRLQSGQSLLTFSVALSDSLFLETQGRLLAVISNVTLVGGG